MDTYISQKIGVIFFPGPLLSYLFSSSCRYVYCLSGAPIGTFTCDGGRRFDGRVCAETEYCNGYLVGQVSRVRIPSPGPSRSRPPPQSQFRPPQPQPQQGFFADLTSGCRNYSFFIGGHETRLSCPQGLLFNGQLCVSEHTYTCPTG